MTTGNHRAGAVRVAIVDEHALIRDALRVALDAEPRIHLVGVARSAAEAYSLARSTAPDVIILDYRLPDAEAPEVIAELRSRGSDAQIVVLTASCVRRNVRAAVDAGARAFLTKRTTDLERLSMAVLDAAAGKDTVSDDALAELLDSMRLPAARRHGPIPTARETEIWRLVATGKANAEIAREAFVSERTVK